MRLTVMLMGRMTRQHQMLMRTNTSQPAISARLVKKSSAHDDGRGLAAW
jgi:hypothetical protein